MTMHHQRSTTAAARTAATSPYSRRHFLQLSSATLAGVVLAACVAPTAQPSEGTSGATTEAVTLSVLNANWADLYNGLMERFGQDDVAATPTLRSSGPLNKSGRPNC